MSYLPLCHQTFLMLELINNYKIIRNGKEDKTLSRSVPLVPIMFVLFLDGIHLYR